MAQPIVAVGAAAVVECLEQEWLPLSSFFSSSPPLLLCFLQRCCQLDRDPSDRTPRARTPCPRSGPLPRWTPRGHGAEGHWTRLLSQSRPPSRTWSLDSGRRGRPANNQIRPKRYPNRQVKGLRDGPALSRTRASAASRSDEPLDTSREHFSSTFGHLRAKILNQPLDTQKRTF